MISSFQQSKISVLTRAILLCELVGLIGCYRSTGVEYAAATNAVLEKVVEKGPVKLRVKISPREPRLSDLVHLDIDVISLQEVDIKPPTFGQAVGDFLVRDYTEQTPPALSHSPTRVDHDEVIRRFRYQLEPVHTGRHLIRSIGIEFVDNRSNSESKGKQDFIESEPFELLITSELGDQVPDLANLEPMVPPRPLSSSSNWIWPAATLAVVLVSGTILWLWRRKKTRREEPRRLTPEEIAHAALRALLAENLPERGQIKEFYLRLTGIVRTYIEGTTGLKAPEQTTKEFLAEIRKRSVFPPDRSTRLIEFLEAADMVKYAGQQPDQDQIALSISRAQEFVDLHSATVDSGTHESSKAYESTAFRKEEI